MILKQPLLLMHRLLPLCGTLVMLAVLGLPTPAPAGDLHAYFDCKSAFEGDTLTLVIETTSGSLGEPDLSGLYANFDLLGEDRRYSTRRDGREYQVVELRYTLSPEHSGKLRIPPVEFEGSVRGSRGQRGGSGGSRLGDAFLERFFQDSPLAGDPFSMFDRGERVSARSRGITLDVKARPGGYAGDDWLPAEALEIADYWAGSLPELRVGEPVKRTLTL